jgi:hypothetical protein
MNIYVVLILKNSNEGQIIEVTTKLGQKVKFPIKKED